MKRTFMSVATILIVALGLGFFNLPYETQQSIVPSWPARLAEQSIHLGLDLQGGTQLDYQIDLRQVEEADREAIIEGVLEVITRRVNGLGVSEPNIYLSQIADEQHVIVELAGVKDLETAKETVGKTIQLEFKEQNTDPVPENLVEEVESQAQTALEQILNGTPFEQVAQSEELANPSQVTYFESAEDSYRFKSDLPEFYFPYLDEIEMGTVVSVPVFGEDGYTADTAGNLIPLEGYYLIQLIDRRDGEKNYHEDKEVEASHLLIAYQGAASADETTTRTKEEAEALAQELKTRLDQGEDFAALAAEYSDDTVSGSNGGELGFFGPSDMVKPFEDAAFGMEIGEISEPVETEFGFHVIQVTDIKPEVNEIQTETEYRFNRIYFSTLGDPWKETGLNGEHFVHADVLVNQTYTPYVSIEFDSEGAILFEELTTRNVGKPIAIFVGGDLISAPVVNSPITGGRAQINGTFSIEEASDLARDLNTGAIPAPILLVGQYTIGASLGQEALNASLHAGLIGLALLMVYMLLYYRLPGLLANFALLIYATLLIFVVKVEMPLLWALGIALVIFGVSTAAIFKNQDSGWEKLLGFLLSCFVLFFFTFLLTNPVVLTLAGVAGVILSIGMAVDANILIFERIREELRQKRPLASAIDIGFDRAWSSIRDSNFSSLITCAILIYFGSSIIQGFAVNLALGILVSMFTAITITRTFLRALVGTRLGENAFLMGIPKKGHSNFALVQKRKIWFGISGVLFAASLLILPVYGLKLGMDFTGGTLMELQFESEITPEVLKETIQTEEARLLAEQVSTEPTTEIEEDAVEDTSTSSSPEDAPLVDSDVSLSSSEPELETIAIDFGEPVIVESGENTLLIRMKHISTETHDALLNAIETAHGSVVETRYTTIGATVGSTMKQKAILAVGMAVIMIVIYIAFAFRQVPKSLGAWRFGVAAIVALLHDIVIPLGIFSILGAVLGVEIDALFITAMLTVMGFSVHDTIVTFDRIRENLNHQKADESLETVANRAVNETLARSINTSVSTLIPVAMLFLFGADSIHYFLLTLIIGIFVGTYSSILIATPFLVWWKERADKR